MNYEIIIDAQWTLPHYAVAGVYGDVDIRKH